MKQIDFFRWFFCFNFFLCIFDCIFFCDWERYGKEFIFYYIHLKMNTNWKMIIIIKNLFCLNWLAIASLPPSLHHSHLAMHHHHHHNALIPNGLAMSSNLNNNSIQTNNNNLANKLINNHQSTNSTKNNNNSNSNDTENHHRHHIDNKTGLLSSNNSSSNSPNHLSSRPVTPGIFGFTFLRFVVVVVGFGAFYSFDYKISSII